MVKSKGMRGSPILLSVLTCLIIAPCAYASVALNIDPSAMPDGHGGFWRGTVEFAATGGVLAAKVDYAVYLPQSHGGLYYGGSVSVPDDHYVYAYQIYNIDQPDGSPLITFTVGLMENSGAENGQNDPYYGELGGIESAIHIPTVNSFQVVFLFPQLEPGAHSEVVLFTSPYGPMYTDASVIESGPSWQSYGAPTPIPEPASLIAFLGFTGLAVLRGGHKKSC